MLIPHILINFYDFFFNDTATTEIYTLSLHDALPIYPRCGRRGVARAELEGAAQRGRRSEEHTSELQSPDHLVCRLLLEKKKANQMIIVIGRKRKNERPIYMRE